MEQQQNPNQDTLVLVINSDIALEGLEMAMVEYQCKDEKEDQWGFTLKTKKIVPFPPDLRQQIIDTIKFYSTQPTDKFDDDKFNAVDKKIGEFVIKQVEEFENYNSASLIAFNPILIHLIVREKDKPKSAVFAAKFGVDLAQKTKIRVICNFFAYDFFLRGNGGPYHCIGQAKLFPKQQYQINLSGYASVTSYKTMAELGAENKPAEDKNKEENKIVEADGYSGQFVYPAMLAINYASGKWDSSQQYDLGNVNPEFEKLITSVSYPYTTKAFAELMQKIDSSQISKPDKVATLCSIISKQIKQVIQEQKWQKKEVYIVGTHSQTLNQAVQKELKGEVTIQKATEYQETITLGFIALRKNKTLLNVFKGATKSISNHCSGVIYIPTDKPLIMEKSPNLQTLQQFQQQDKKEQKQKLENSEDFNNEIIPINDQPQMLKSGTLRHQTQSLKK